MAGFFNEKLIKALFTREYICPDCGSMMEFEDEEFADTLVCLNCGKDMDLDEYGADPYENLYPTYEAKFGDDK